VSGEYTKLDKAKHITQKWRLKQWPEGHYSTLGITFDQNDVDSVTTMRVEWKGVPVGQEEVTKKNWSEYYVRSIKYVMFPPPLWIQDSTRDSYSHKTAMLTSSLCRTTFGFGSIL